MPDLEEQIDARVGEVRSEALDLSFGEIVNLHSNSELIIQPEYQRLFRWSDDQRSRLIESILLELPVPQIFVIENTNGVLELIDGLQRISSVIQFINSNLILLDPLELQGCDLIPDLNGNSFASLPLSLRLRVKRASVRTIVIKRQSKSFLRYEMFKRLNTGGAILSPQEIRNCSARMLGEDGTQFYALIQELASMDSFKTCTETLAQQEHEQKGDEELVLRFFACKNSQDLFRGSVRDWLDAFMEGVLLKTIPFDVQWESQAFKELFDFLESVLGAGAFVKYRGQSAVGGLAPAYFEAVSTGIFRSLSYAKNASPTAVRQAVIDTVQTEEFRQCTGPGANTKQKLNSRINLICDAIKAL
ncbi:DUF262 domain-containing protein [Bremerella cremea]|uniref:DUF262 domain-containing protein n=1 Tax=Bremerella cremea TaxID=1031537 RepID=A0A368KL80_9BACT|nr:DUF262 domain-containing protein [Bremerella cremea]RCS41546.1 DUF262 domain-containing protein [Bremerella cremea]